MRKFHFQFRRQRVESHNRYNVLTITE
ncbi:hypothetical protein FEK42_21890 [Escherichia sp. E2748]|nr:hypothetical protein FEK42_21890 [Escherichia sp. E2748]